MTETLAYGYSSESAQRELSNEYQHDRVQMVFRNLCILVLWTNVALALAGLTPVHLEYTHDLITLDMGLTRIKNAVLKTQLQNFSLLRFSCSATLNPCTNYICRLFTSAMA